MIYISDIQFQTPSATGAALVLVCIAIMVGYELQMGIDYPFYVLWLGGFLNNFVHSSVSRGGCQRILWTMTGSLVASIYVFVLNVGGLSANDTTGEEDNVLKIEHL